MEFRASKKTILILIMCFLLLVLAILGFIFKDKIQHIINIRDFYKDATYNAKEIYDIFYKDKISYSTFEKIYEGYTWKGIHMDVYTELNKI